MVNITRPGALFVVLFVGSSVLLGELVGSFADSDAQFVTLFSDSGNRISYVAGSALMLLAGPAFVWFAHALSCETGSRRAPLLITGAAAAIGMHCRRAGVRHGAAQPVVRLVLRRPRTRVRPGRAPAVRVRGLQLGRDVAGGNLHGDRGPDPRSPPALVVDRELSVAVLVSLTALPLHAVRPVRPVGRRGDRDRQSSSAPMIDHMARVSSQPSDL